MAGNNGYSFQDVLSNIFDPTTNSLRSTPISAAQVTTGLLRFGDVLTAATATVPVRRSNLSNVITVDTALTINSSSVNDTAAGTGARTVEVTYYKQDGSGPFISNATMNGTTVVFLPSMSFIEKLRVLTVGSAGSNVGNINISLLSPLTNIATMNPGDNETFFCHHFIPLGKTMYLTSFMFNNTSNSAAQGGVFRLTKQTIPFTGSPITSVMGAIHLSGTNGTESVAFTNPIVIHGPAYISCSITPDSATSNTYTCAMNFYDL